MKTLTTATALAALLAASSAFGQAQDQFQDPLAAPEAAEPSAPPDATTLPEAMPSEPAPDTAGEAESAPDESVASGDAFITQQADDETLASALIGTSVANSAGESLGSIKDIVLSEDGQANVIVIGVGGFLGIGQKNVGVPFDSIDKSTDADGNVSLILDADAEELEAAPAFVTVNELRQEMEQPDAGADPMAPAPEGPLP